MLLFSQTIETPLLLISPATIFFMISAFLGGLYLAKNALKDKENISKVTLLLSKSAPLIFPCSIIFLKQIAI